MEEFRVLLADRTALSMINRREIDKGAFEEFPGGAVYLSELGRRKVLQAFQRRKQDEVAHRVLGRKVPIGLIPHIQARLLARHLRGDLDHYPPFLYR
jgi:CRISPR-associated protein Cas1